MPQPAAQVVEPTGHVGGAFWGEAHRPAAGFDGSLQVGKLPRADVAVPQPAAQVIEDSGQIGGALWREAHRLFQEGNNALQVFPPSKSPITTQAHTRDSVQDGSIEVGVRPKIRLGQQAFPCLDRSI